jgi:hypothetical protein
MLLRKRLSYMAALQWVIMKYDNDTSEPLWCMGYVHAVIGKQS